MGFWGVVNNCIKNADVIVMVIDARMPEETMNREVLKKAEMKGKKVLYLFNKTDLISSDVLDRIKSRYTKGSFFVSIKKKRTLSVLKRELSSLASDLEHPLRVALLGYPNVGKSSILNILVPGFKSKVSSVAGTTKKTGWVRSGNIRYMDSPGVIPRSDSKVKVGITASKDPGKIKDPEKVAANIVERIMSNDSKILEDFYGLKIDEHDSYYDVFHNIGKAKKMLQKGGEVDEDRTAVKIIKDWQEGRLRLA